MNTILNKILWFTAKTILCLMVILFTAIGCDKQINENKYYIVNFKGIGVDIAPQSIEYGMCAEVPESPIREGYDFSGWFTINRKWHYIWDFKNNIITQDTTLFVIWEETTLPEENLKGTKWKLIGIGSLDNITINEIEPENCDICYTLSFDTGNTITTFTLENTVFCNYTVNYAEKSICVFNLITSEVEVLEPGDRSLFLSILHKINSFSLQKNKLYLFYNENEKINYLLYKSLES